MSQNTKKDETLNEQDAFEMIEMAIDDLDLLTRAFEIVSEVCQQRDEAVDASCDGDTTELSSFMIH